ncbi:MAG: FAD:protein FMN transferase [Candidatus Thiodiazotropha sp. (ex Monitilora ramsayi)]|nr:FAD:protein FMN transferase [Candidatus Thiodiazotropha sp. (ex Monitilora ramsayi)]
MTRQTPFISILLMLLMPSLVLGNWHKGGAAIMGTRISVEIWHEDNTTAKHAIEAVLDEFRRIDRALSPYIEESELFRVNRDADKQRTSISQEFFDLLERSLAYSQLTDGAFDITFASIGYHYDFRKGIRPSEDVIGNALPLINYRLIRLDTDSRTVAFAQEGVRIDLGGIAKGYAVDRGIGILQRLGIEHALISAGGDSRLLGDHRGRPWHIGIQAPRNKEALAAVLPLSETAVSTSGDYERFFERDGVRHHHIISPKTGRSAGELRSVTILGPNTTHTDALSTSVFVLGLKEGLALINRLDDVEAVIIDNQGKMHMSKGMEDLRPSSAEN